MTHYSIHRVLSLPNCFERYDFRQSYLYLRVETFSVQHFFIIYTTDENYFLKNADYIRILFFSFFNSVVFISNLQLSKAQLISNVMHLSLIIYRETVKTGGVIRIHTLFIMTFTRKLVTFQFKWLNKTSKQNYIQLYIFI